MITDDTPQEVIVEIENAILKYKNNMIVEEQAQIDEFRKLVLAGEKPVAISEFDKQPLVDVMEIYTSNPEDTIKNIDNSKRVQKYEENKLFKHLENLLLNQ